MQNVTTQNWNITLNKKCKKKVTKFNFYDIFDLKAGKEQQQQEQQHSRSMDPRSSR